MRSPKLLTMAAVLFVAVILLPRGTMGAKAQGVPDPGAAASVVVALAVHGEFDGTGSTVYRLWDDALIQVNSRTCTGCAWAGWVDVPE